MENYVSFENAEDIFLEYSNKIKDNASDISDLNTNKQDKKTTLDGYGITDAKIENGTITLGSNTITPLTEHQDLSSYVTNVKVGDVPHSPTNGIVSLPSYPTSLPASDTVSEYDPTGTHPVNGKAVADALEDLPEPMIFKGSLGTGGTISTLPTASSSNKGFTYKVITAGTYASQSARVGDIFISDGSAWVLIPSGDDPSGTGTVTSVGIGTDGGISISGSPITTSGTIKVSHADTSSQSSIAAMSRRYINAIKLDTYGHVTELGTGSETVQNTTYTLGISDKQITLTPNQGQAQAILVPYATTAARIPVNPTNTPTAVGSVWITT